MIDGVYADIKAAAEQELKRAKMEHGAVFASLHEAYGVLAEELFEVGVEVKAVNGYADRIVELIHRDDGIGLVSALYTIKQRAILAACEMVQVAAVCEKAIRGISSVCPVENQAPVR